MTREEAVEVLKERYLTCVGIGLDNHANRVNEAIDMAIEALNSVTDSENGAVESKNDVIKRQDAIEAIESRQTEQWIESDIDYNSGLESALCEIKALPSAEPKTGKWMKVIDEETPNVTKWHYECDQCGAGRFENGQQHCSRCGARMLGEDGEA